MKLMGSEIIMNHEVMEYSIMNDIYDEMYGEANEVAGAAAGLTVINMIDILCVSYVVSDIVAKVSQRVRENDKLLPDAESIAYKQILTENLPRAAGEIARFTRQQKRVLTIVEAKKMYKKTPRIVADYKKKQAENMRRIEKYDKFVGEARGMAAKIKHYIIARRLRTFTEIEQLDSLLSDAKKLNSQIDKALSRRKDI